MAKLDAKDYKDQSPEVSEKDVELGVYVHQAKDEEDQPVGEKVFLASNDAAHVEAFLHAGFRKASEKETKEYVDRTEAAKKESRQSIEKQDKGNE